MLFLKYSVVVYLTLVVEYASKGNITNIDTIGTLVHINNAIKINNDCEKKYKPNTFNAF